MKVLCLASGPPSSARTRCPTGSRRAIQQALIDATRVVIQTQELAGIDVVCDGELYRFDVNHPETNGMIEYFMRPMDGIRTRHDVRRSGRRTARSPACASARGRRASSRAPIGEGTLNLPRACARAKALRRRPFKFTVTGPHMLAKTLLDRHYGDTPKLAHAIADVLAEQVSHIDADVVQVDEANLPGHPDEWAWAAAAINHVLDAVPGREGRAPVLRQLRRPGDPARHLGAAAAASSTRCTPTTSSWRFAHRRLRGARSVFKRARSRRSASASASSTSRRPRSRSPTRSRARSSAPRRSLGAGRVRYVHPDCGFWMLKRTIADAKMRALVAGRDLYEGRQSA